MTDQSCKIKSPTTGREPASITSGIYARGDTIGATSISANGLQSWTFCNRNSSGERPFGKCLELACGTGLWTACLARGAAGLTAIDAASETIEINRTKIGDAQVRYVIADLFEWRPIETYDFIFFGFWLSHVPARQFNRFWEMVRAALKPDGRGFFRRQPGNPRVDRTGPPRTQRFRSRRKEAERWPDFQCGKSIPRPGSVEPAAARSWAGMARFKEAGSSFTTVAWRLPKAADEQMRASRRANLSRQSVMIIASPAVALAGSGAQQRYGKRERQRSIDSAEH